MLAPRKRSAALSGWASASTRTSIAIAVGTIARRNWGRVSRQRIGGIEAALAQPAGKDIDALILIDDLHASCGGRGCRQSGQQALACDSRGAVRALFASMRAEARGVARGALSSAVLHECGSVICRRGSGTPNVGSSAERSTMACSRYKSATRARVVCGSLRRFRVCGCAAERTSTAA